MAKHIWLGLTAVCLVMMFSTGGDNPRLALQYSLMAIVSAFISGVLYGNEN